MGYDGFTAAKDRLPQWECGNCRARGTPPRPSRCPQCGRNTAKAAEQAPRIWREDVKNRVGWTRSVDHLGKLG